jgi:hypothetical protein
MQEHVGCFAIVGLAIDNYIEMLHHSPSFAGSSDHDKTAERFL